MSDIIPRESEFTPPSEHCPNPQHWTARDGMGTEEEVIELVAAFVRAIQPELVVETGTYLGFASKAIGEALKKNGHGKLITLEIDTECADKASELCKDLPVEVICTSSLNWLPPQHIDFAWFDSEGPLRPKEFLHYYPFLKGSTVGFHDTAPHHPTRSYIEAEISDKISPIYLKTPRGVCFAEVI